MAGYSGTPLAKKLGVKPGFVVSLVDAPEGWTIPELPDGARFARGGKGNDADVIVLFIRSVSALLSTIGAFATRIHPDRTLWVAWPRKAGGHISDVDENGIRSAALPLGLVDVKVAALDDDWSALKLVWRKELR